MSEILSGECLVSKPLVLGQKAPNFAAEAYYRGDPINVKLSDFKGRWVLLFFYKSDFTFV